MNIRNEYTGYCEWKRWDEGSFFKCSPRNQAYFRREFSGYNFRAARVLEVGFGNGELLAWLSERGAVVHGAEASDDLVAAAKLRGVIVVDPAATPEMDGLFDIIILMDVFEHMTLAELRVSLAWYKRNLAPTGRLLARFPNGQSPLSAPYQFGDATHKTQLSAANLQQFASEAGLRLVGSRRPSTTNYGGVVNGIPRMARYLLQVAFERLLKELYSFNCVMSPNVFVEIAHER